MSTDVTVVQIVRPRGENKMTDIKTGIHSYAVSMVLTAKQYYEIKKAISPIDNGSDYFSDIEQYYSNILADRGIKIYLSKHG